MANEKIYGRKWVTKRIPLSLEVDGFLQGSVENASRFIEYLIMSAKTGINPVLFTISQNRGKNPWACPGSNRRSSPCKGDVITD